MPVLRQSRLRPLRRLFLFLAFTVSLTSFAAELRGTVRDSLGALIPSAKVDLLDERQTVIASTTTDPTGEFGFAIDHAGRYSVRAATTGFATSTSNPVYLAASQQARVDITLHIGEVQQSVTVTATGVPALESQVGASVSVLESPYPGTLDIEQSLRLLPGLQVSTSGQRGAVSSLFIRGGDSNANKVLIDGVPINDIGGTVNFGSVEANGLTNIEVFRGPNSALFGQDALAGVVSLNTDHGVTPLPFLTYSAEGGNFNTYRQEGSVAGAYRAIDYYADFGRWDTSNSLPNSTAHDATIAGNFGYTFSPRTLLRGTVRRVSQKADEPNALLLFGVPDTSNHLERDLYLSATFEDHTTEKWHNLVRYGAQRLRALNNSPLAFGILDNNGPLDANCFEPQQFVGTPVIIRGANGYTVSGRAFTGSCPGFNPQTFSTTTNRDFVYAQTDYAHSEKLVALAGFRFENARGKQVFTEPGFESPATANRDDYLGTLQLGGTLFERLYYTVGAGLEHNSVFGFEPTPRVSLAYYVLRPRPSGFLTGTRLRFNFGKGILEPTVPAQNNSLFALLSGLPNGADLIQQFHVSPIHAQRSRSYDGGVDQEFLNGRALASIIYFHNEFGDVPEFLGSLQSLTALGVPPPLAQIVVDSFGAYINSLAFRAQGLEAIAEYHISNHFFARGGYTYLDATVQRSFSSGVLSPAFNPDFPGIPIGQYSPLKGARPFRRSPQSGYFALGYSRSKWAATLTGTLVGRRDDSTFLTDSNGGNTLLLPNKNLDPAYQRLALSGSYDVTHHIRAFASADNLLAQHYQEVFGFPALPFTFRAGLRFNIGGESWQLK
jgi:vitamin B12 transporter